jgi:heparosan-N-sulfate-glucuronate 5-epimerase
MNRSTFMLKFSVVLIVSLMVISMVAAQETPEPQDYRAILDALPLTVDPNNYSRPCSAPYELSPLEHYEVMLQTPKTQLDSSGVMLLDYGSSYDNAGWQYSISQIAFFGMSALESWCETQDQLALQLAVNQADWLIANAVSRDNFVTWLYNFPNPNFLTPSLWSSGLSNGVVIYFLTQLHAISGDQKYMDTAQLAVNSFLVDMKDGGVRSVYDDGSVVFEETAHPEAPPTFILNGHMLAVQSLAYYADYSGDTTAAKLVEEGIQAVRNKLPEFDFSTIALYSLGPIRWGSARNHYAHGIHVRGLFWMYERTNDPIFLRYTFDWQHYKWPAIPSDIYNDVFSVGSLMGHNPDLKRWYEEPLDTKAFVVDLREVRPLRSFGYSMDAPYPTDFTISVSDDAENWREVKAVTNYTKAHGMFDLGDITARFVQFKLGDMVNDLPLYYELRDGVYTDWMLLGITRVDDAAYWEDPILLVTRDTFIFDDAQYLRDDDAATTIPLDPDSVLYVDLRSAKAPSEINITGSGTSTRQIRFEASTDMQTWIPMSEGDQTVTLPGVVAFPQTDTPYQYWRIHFEGSDPLVMDTVTVR